MLNISLYCFTSKTQSISTYLYPKLKKKKNALNPSCSFRLDCPCPHSFHCLFFSASGHTVVSAHTTDSSHSWQAMMKKHPMLHHNCMKKQLSLYKRSVKGPRSLSVGTDTFQSNRGDKLWRVLTDRQGFENC